MNLTSEKHQEIIELANINKDACEFYQDAKMKVDNPELIRTFDNLEKLHGSVVINLKEYLDEREVSPEVVDETANGKVLHLWSDLKAKFSSNPDATFVSQLEEAEDRCLHKVEEIMESDDITPNTKLALSKEHRALRRSHDYMKSLKELMVA